MNGREGTSISFPVRAGETWEIEMEATTTETEVQKLQKRIAALEERILLLSPHPKRPHRQFVIEVGLGGDTWEDVRRGILEIANTINDREIDAVDGVMGGPSVGFFIRGKHDPEMTHERYHPGLDQYDAAMNNERETLRQLESSRPEIVAAAKKALEEEFPIPPRK